MNNSTRHITLSLFVYPTLSQSVEATPVWLYQSHTWLWRNFVLTFITIMFNFIEVSLRHLFESHHNISIRLNSGLWLSHWKTLIRFFFKRFVLFFLSLDHFPVTWANLGKPLAVRQMTSHLVYTDAHGRLKDCTVSGSCGCKTSKIFTPLPWLTVGIRRLCWHGVLVFCQMWCCTFW